MIEAIVRGRDVLVVYMFGNTRIDAGNGKQI